MLSLKMPDGLVVRVLDSHLGDPAQNQWVPPKLTQLVILISSIKYVLRTPGNLLVKSKLSLCSGQAALRQLNPVDKTYLNLQLVIKEFRVLIGPNLIFLVTHVANVSIIDTLSYSKRAIKFFKIILKLFCQIFCKN